MSAPGTIVWFARHEFRLAWRDWMAMMTAGRRARIRTLAVVFVILAVVMHAVAFVVVSRFADSTPDKTTLVVITGTVLMMWSLMLSHAMEQVARAFYARSDLELLLSSPADARTIFSVRLGAIAVSVMTTALVTAAPFINVLFATGGARWLGAYAAVLGIGAAAAAAATILTAAMFEMVGPKRTRLIAQIAAAVIGAGFVIALQFAVIASTGTMSRVALLASEPIVAMAPDGDSIVWWPARAVLGDVHALAIVLGASLVVLGASIAAVAPRFAACVTAAAGVANAAARTSRRETAFRTASPIATLRLKEWRLLARDPWLVSQTLMQLLYLLPPAFLLWRSFGDNSGAEVLLVPVLVMAAGQLAGGLAWLAVSAEDAPDLITTAPLLPAQILRAKIDTVMGAIAVLFAPFLVALALISPFCAVVTAIGNALAAASSTHIQLCFRAQAKRSHFRRRQTSSRIATFAEAFVSIGWAAAAALAASGTFAAVMPAAMAVGVLAGARYISPHKLG
jgi:ABC-2 type transport system permease protein